MRKAVTAKSKLSGLQVADLTVRELGCTLHWKTRLDNTVGGEDGEAEGQKPRALGQGNTTLLHLGRKISWSLFSFITTDEIK